MFPSDTLKEAWHRLQIIDFDCLKLVGAAGIEPATLGLEIRCSIRLSYAPLMQITAVELEG
jgi:hypothetical protein